MAGMNRIARQQRNWNGSSEIARRKQRLPMRKKSQKKIAGPGDLPKDVRKQNFLRR